MAHWKPLFVIAIFMGTLFYFSAATPFVNLGNGQNGELVRDRDNIPSCNPETVTDVTLVKYDNGDWEEKSIKFTGVNLRDAPGIFSGEWLELSPNQLQGEFISQEVSLEASSEFNLETILVSEARLAPVNGVNGVFIYSRFNNETNYTIEYEALQNTTAAAPTSTGTDEATLPFASSPRTVDEYKNLTSAQFRVTLVRNTSQDYPTSINSLAFTAEYQTVSATDQVRCNFAVLKDYFSLIFIDSGNVFIDIIFNGIVIILIFIFLKLLIDLITTLPFFG